MDYLGQDEIEEGPEFGKVILQRSTSENKPVPRVIVCGEGLYEFTLRALQTMTFVI